MNLLVASQSRIRAEENGHSGCLTTISMIPIVKISLFVIRWLRLRSTI